MQCFIKNSLIISLLFSTTTNFCASSCVPPFRQFTVHSLLDEVDCRLIENDATINSKLDVIDENIDILNQKIGNGFQDEFTGTWTMIDAHDASLDACCFTVNSRLDDVSTDFRETWTVLDGLDNDIASCCSTVNNKLDDLSTDLRETWTVLSGMEGQINANMSRLDHLEMLVISAIDLLLGHI